MGCRTPYEGRLLTELPLFHHVFGIDKADFLALTLRDYRAYKTYLRSLTEEPNG